MDKELLVKEICDADKKKKKPRRGEHQNDDNSIGKVLRILSNSEGEVHPTDLCQKLEVTTPRITVILNEMEDKGLVERQISKEDRRKILIVLPGGCRGISAGSECRAGASGRAQSREAISGEQRRKITLTKNT